MSQLQSHIPYAPPFDLRHFYLTPKQWLQAVKSAGDIDSLHLLSSVHVDDADFLAFPLQEPEGYWLRDNPDGLPNLVSHPTYYAWLEHLWNLKWLANCDDTQPSKLKHSGCYKMLGWPKFDGQGFLYTPRSYVRHRWPRLFVQNELGIRLALVACSDLLSKAAPATGPTLLTVNISHHQLSQAAAKLVPHLYNADKIGQALVQLSDMGILTSVPESSGHNNRWYRFQSNVFDKLPTWPLEEIASLCLLDSTLDAHWLRLIQAFLRFNYLPMNQAIDVWSKIREYDRWLVTPEDVDELLTHLTAKAGHSSTSPGRVLSDFEKQREQGGRRYWVDSEAISVPLVGAINRSASLPIPAPSHANDSRVALSLLIKFDRGPRLSIQDAQTELSRWTLWVVQEGKARRMTQQLQVDYHAFTRHLSFSLDISGLSIDHGHPIRIFIERKDIEAEDASTPISLHCRLRSFYRREPSSGKERQYTPHGQDSR